jgi:hypothetical protein
MRLEQAVRRQREQVTDVFMRDYHAARHDLERRRTGLG